MQQENALIGVAEAAYFPDISPVRHARIHRHQSAAVQRRHAIWSLGASGTQTLFNGGLTSAQVDAARAVYWQSVANYRQTVLTAFQQVEDELAAIRILCQQLMIGAAGGQGRRASAVDVYLNQYQRRHGRVHHRRDGGRRRLLSDEEAELTVRQNLFLASVSLIEALGGGWDTTLLPDQAQMLKGFSLVPKLESTVPLAIELIPAPQTPSNPPTAPPPAAQYRAPMAVRP